jgi:hypothetical protein
VQSVLKPLFHQPRAKLFQLKRKRVILQLS